MEQEEHFMTLINDGDQISVNQPLKFSPKVRGNEKNEKK